MRCSAKIHTTSRRASASLNVVAAPSVSSWSCPTARDGQAIAFWACSATVGGSWSRRSECGTRAGDVADDRQPPVSRRARRSAVLLER